MKLYQTHLGYAITIKAEIGDTDDGWSVNDGTHLPNDARVEVVYRDGGRDANLRASDLIWNDAGHPRDVVAYRIIKPKLQLSLEIGGIYRARNGEIHGPLKAFDHHAFTFAAECRTWTPSGRYLISEENGLDLVEHITTVPGEGWIAWNEPHCPFSYENPVLEVVQVQGTLPEARPAKNWLWTFDGKPAILAYRVVHAPKFALTLEERVARLEAHLA